MKQKDIPVVTYLPPHRSSFNSSHTHASVVHFPFERMLADNPRVQWVFRCIDGKENCEKKRLLVLAAAGEIEVLTHWEETALIVGLGLETA